MYTASAESWGDTRFVVTTRHASFVTDTQGKGANPVDTLLASLCSCLGHYVRDYLVATGSPEARFRVAAESDAPRDAPKLEAISVRVELGPVALSAQEEAELLAQMKRCKIYGTLREACRVDLALVSGELQAKVA